MDELESTQCFFTSYSSVDASLNSSHKRPFRGEEKRASKCAVNLLEQSIHKWTFAHIGRAAHNNERCRFAAEARRGAARVALRRHRRRRVQRTAERQLNAKNFVLNRL